MTESIPQHIWDKLQALKTMADPARGATPAEIDAATSALHKLLVKHNLNLARVGSPSDRLVSHQGFKAEDRLQQWEKSLLVVLAKHHFCEVVEYPGNQILVIGQPHNSAMVIETFTWIRPHMIDVAQSARVADKDKHIYDWLFSADDDELAQLAKHRPSEWLRSYLAGMVDGIDQQLTEATRQETEGGGSALMALLREEARSYLEEHFTFEKVTVAKNADRGIYRDGFSAGRSFDVTKRKELSS